MSPTAGTHRTQDDERTAVRIGVRIQTLRTDSGWSLRELALRTGVGLPLISDLEAGRALPSIPILYALAAAFAVSPGALLPACEALPHAV
jgi:transcriptional regulator with XRE-family HTH domain